MSDHGYISVRNWRRFQHYDPAKRGQPWIKDYLDQLDDDGYRDLSYAQRGLLQDIRRAYARARCALSADTVRLSRRLGKQVTRPQLEALNRAGFLDFVASASLADGYHVASEVASTEVEVEVEVEALTHAERGTKTLKCKTCGADVAPRATCRACGANPRAAGSNARALAANGQPERRARNWIDNGLADHVPDAHLEEVLADEFGIARELAAELATYAKARHE